VKNIVGIVYANGTIRTINSAPDNPPIAINFTNTSVLYELYLTKEERGYWDATESIAPIKVK